MTESTYEKGSKYFKECRRCEKPFLTNNIRRIFCGNSCKCLWRRENNEDFAEKWRKYHSKYARDWHLKNKKRMNLLNKANFHTRRNPANPITPEDILIIYERDEYTCQYCNKEDLSGSDLTIEHIIPLSKGGENKINNMCVACFSCNSKKMYNKKIKPKVMSFD